MIKFNKKVLISLVVGAGILAIALDPTIHVRRYTIKTDNLQACIAVLSDFHSQPHPSLISKLRHENPQLILLPGDIIDDKLPEMPAWELLKACAEIAPTYYVVGNHEVWTKDLSRIKKMVENAGVTCINNSYETIMLNGHSLVIAGIDDPYNHPNWDVVPVMKNVFSKLPEEYRILLAHRPEQFSKYEGYGFDLVVSGHTHGGQWRFPGIFNGIYAPHQGKLPKYAGGIYEHKDFTQVVCRGTYYNTPVMRIFNPPEFVILTLTR